MAPKVSKVIQPPKDQEPSSPVKMDMDGMDKLARVSHLTLLAKDLASKNQPSYQLDMPRVRELKLDVQEAELPMLRTLLNEQNVRDFANSVDEVLFQPIMVKPFGSEMVPNKFQRSLNSPRLDDVKVDANDRTKIPRARSGSLENSPVIGSKKPKRASMSQEPKVLQSK